jgi:hypothetical protein
MGPLATLQPRSTQRQVHASTECPPRPFVPRPGYALPAGWWLKDTDGLNFLLFTFSSRFLRGEPGGTKAGDHDEP